MATFWAAVGLALLAERQRVTEAALAAERRSAYAHRVGLAHREARANNWPRADKLLAECPHDLRHWEWRYLRRTFRAKLFTRDPGEGRVPAAREARPGGKTWPPGPSSRRGAGRPGQQRAGGGGTRTDRAG